MLDIEGRGRLGHGQEGWPLGKPENQLKASFRLSECTPSRVCRNSWEEMSLEKRPILGLVVVV